jgi:hypothetical protein
MFWEGKAYDINSDLEDIILWNHDIQGILKACCLLKDNDSKLIVTLPAGPYMNYEKSGYPFLRYYNSLRQNIIHEKIKFNGFKITNESFYYSNDFTNWELVSKEINESKYYSYYNTYTPNVIWGITIQKS